MDEILGILDILDMLEDIFNQMTGSDVEEILNKLLNRKIKYIGNSKWVVDKNTMQPSRES